MLFCEQGHGFGKAEALEVFDHRPMPKAELMMPSGNDFLTSDS